MPRNVDVLDFDIFVDPSCLSAPMDEETRMSDTRAEEKEKKSDSEVSTTGDKEAKHGQIFTANIAVADKNVGEVQQEEEMEMVVRKDSGILVAGPPSEPTVSSIEYTPEDRRPETLPATDTEAALLKVGDDSLEKQDCIEKDSQANNETQNGGNDIPVEFDADTSATRRTESQAADVEGEDSKDMATPRQMLRNRDASEKFDLEIEETSSSCRRSLSSIFRGPLRTEAAFQVAARAVVAGIEQRQSPGSTGDGEKCEAGQEQKIAEELDTVEADRRILSIPSSLHVLDTDDGVQEDGANATAPTDNTRRLQSFESTIYHVSATQSICGCDGGDSSSHQGGDDEVFSHSSGRSSMGSVDGIMHNACKAPEDESTVCDEPSSPTPPARRRISPRHTQADLQRHVSHISLVSGLSQCDQQESFLPCSSKHSIPRMPFRSPSAVRAMQMSSPTPSVFTGAVPSSAKRSCGVSATVFPSVSRLDSSTQSSFKRRTTPARFKTRQGTAPLVLLHVTLLPLRWPWADVLENLDLLSKSSGSRPSEGIKTLRDAWCALRDRVGDTVLERGILLPHPQGDYEILEERLLEALELTQLRRAKILECGHYLGASNMEDEESEDEYASQSIRAVVKAKRRHWCLTCEGEIRLENLGRGNVFCVKVYASNGLMRAGAWEACWKEMERIDVELEPIIDPALRRELEDFTTAPCEVEAGKVQQDNRATKVEEISIPFDSEPVVDGDMERDWDEDPVEDPMEDQSSFLVSHSHRTMASSSVSIAMPANTTTIPVSSASHIPISTPCRRRQKHRRLGSRETGHSEPLDNSRARNLRDEERIREIYGDDALLEDYDTPPSSRRAEWVRTYRHDSGLHVPQPSHRSLSEERGERQRGRTSSYQNASLLELLLEVAKLLVQDPRNVAIAVLAVFLVFAISKQVQEAQGTVFVDNSTDASAAGVTVVGVMQTDKTSTSMVMAASLTDDRLLKVTVSPISAALELEKVNMVHGPPSSLQSLSQLYTEVIHEPRITCIRETVTQTETFETPLTTTETQQKELVTMLRPLTTTETVYEILTETRTEIELRTVKTLMPAPGPSLLAHADKKEAGEREFASAKENNNLVFNDV